jgi:hypothetical protein
MHSGQKNDHKIKVVNKTFSLKNTLRTRCYLILTFPK